MATALSYITSRMPCIPLYYYVFFVDRLSMDGDYVGHLIYF